MTHSLSSIRRLFIQYFQAQQHTLFESASLVPLNDPSILFINAGMTPLKAYFTHPEDPRIPATKSIVSVQRCMRVSGKHNDLSMIGFSPRHHTFFEMAGNFSFGAYDRAQAIALAYHFLTQVIQLPPTKLCFSVMQHDSVTKQLWQQVAGRDAEVFEDPDNFWAMGAVGPCGPCTEIYYRQANGQLLEIWNIVFMEYTQLASGERLPLAVACIDTGCGLERLTAVVQGVDSNYEIDVFQALTQVVIAQLGPIALAALHVLLDHLRAAVFLIHDGVTASNTGRGYVLRRIIRRFLGFTSNAGYTTAFLPELLPKVLTTLQPFYPDLAPQQFPQITTCLQDEEAKFHLLRAKQAPLLTTTLLAVQKQQLKLVPGKTVFTLYDTHGVSLDHIEDTANAYGLQLDLTGYEQYMKQQQEQSRRPTTTKHRFTEVSQFTGYTHLTDQGQIIGLYDEQDLPVTQLAAHAKGKIVLDNTPFYAEAGGQCGDIGMLMTLESANTFQVLDVQKDQHAIIHSGVVLTGIMAIHTVVQAVVDAPGRQNACLHHTSAHLLLSSLQQLLGDSVQPKGCLVQREKLRFDFLVQREVSATQLAAIEQRMNELITQALPTQVTYKTHAEAVAAKVGFLADCQYHHEQLRILTIGDTVSCEACCGTHVRNTSEIGIFKIIKYSSIAAGIKRIEAIAGNLMNLRLMQQYETWLQDSMTALQLNSWSQVVPAIQKLQQSIVTQKQQSSRDQEALFTFYAQTLRGQDQVVAGYFPQVDDDMLKQKIGSLCQQFPTQFLVLTNNSQRFYLAAHAQEEQFSQVILHLKTAFGLKGGIHKQYALLTGSPGLSLEQLVVWINKRIMEESASN